MKFWKFVIAVPGLMIMTFLVMSVAGGQVIQNHSTILGNYLHAEPLDMTDPGVD